MKNRSIIKEIHGKNAVDGAGVHMVRVLSAGDVKDFDPFLMLDSFDSTNPNDYIAGFPMHPHRGIETITYLISGKIEHKDSLGNKDVINSGEAQWMTAGSGILHEENPKESQRMLGIQLWLNLPRSEKMTDPAYLSLTKNDIATKHIDGAEIRVLSGKFDDATGVIPKHIPVTIYDINLSAEKKIKIPTKFDETVFIFLIEGDALVENKRIQSKTAVLFDSGESLSVTAPADSASRFIFFSGSALKEPIAWGGPIVMNTQEELSAAFDELSDGTFIKHK